jgi:hypothetical protein
MIVWNRMNSLNNILRFVIVAGFLVLGYFIHDLSWDHRKDVVPRPPKRAEVPAVFYEAEYHNLLAPVEIRNGLIEKFLWAWNNSERYAVYDNGYGLDEIISMYWVTDCGTIMCLLANNDGLFQHRVIRFLTVSQPSLLYSPDEDKPFVVVGPEIFEDRKIVMTRELTLSFRPIPKR